ncbi:Predicted arabinose efflux permease, MFS family [Mesorhizobium albiziae]|uniref:Predicted arabinose efflux permease, MFS family n=1 Tax=Neomesorhizobium albiziae TaxID=335020 RepID=A0A1I4EDJ2_9HYPH|nr:YbfB/YjiJ family MFS transporter [Mesorhizobium albiziae]GLS31114.1 MFS transporter [Mesorhizobium albiziae]SFL02436.1 Predicted arabinose efflux permease, MFS family [Mesorhizobium albiziae]
MDKAPANPLRYAIAGMTAMAVAMGIGRFVYTPILPSMMEEIGLSASNAGLIASANYLGYLLGAIAAAGGWAHGRERAVMLVSLAASALLAGAMGLTENLAAFTAIRFFAGVASAFVMVFVITIVFSHLAAAGRNSLQALHFGGVGVGIAVSSVMTGALVLAGSAWPAGWLWSGALSIAGFLVVLLMIDRGPLVGGIARREPQLPKSGALAKIIVAYGLFGLGYIVTATFIVAIVRQGDGGRLFESAVWLVTGLAGIPSVYLWARMAPRLGLTATFALGCIVEAIGVVASVSLGGVAGPLIGGILLGGTFIAITAIGLQAGRLLAPAAPRRALALMTASFGTGQILGPIAAGYLADWTGSFVVPSIGAALVLLLCAAIGYDAGRKQVLA